MRRAGAFSRPKSTVSGKASRARVGLWESKNGVFFLQACSRSCQMPRLLRILENELAGLDIAAGAPGEELLGGPRGVGGSTVAMAKGKKKKSAKKLALAEDAKAETKADGEFDAALNRPSLAALASAGAPGAASTPSRSGKPVSYTHLTLPTILLV